MAVPLAMPGRYLAFCASLPATTSQAAQVALGDEGAGDERPAELLDEDTEVEVAKAGATVLFGDHEPLPAEVGHLLPEVGTVASLVLFHGPYVLFGALVLKEIARRFADQGLLFAKAQIHRCPSFFRVAKWAHTSERPLAGVAARV